MYIYDYDYDYVSTTTIIRKLWFGIMMHLSSLIIAKLFHPIQYKGAPATRSAMWFIFWLSNCANLLDLNQSNQPIIMMACPPHLRTERLLAMTWAVCTVCSSGANLGPPSQAHHHKLASPSADHHYREAGRHPLDTVPARSQSLI